ncbi:hypothetical protein K9L67_02500 [Candidatus Woesearchaeota archaeon]|nr:hypothetical protein [Candidatus Woesearchaeota archaeon]MCF7901076.1 hypothetical protein [Candidatus Woesearchaeota archaeon]MCF8013627.1 hypothetical protein [Candidatus Woesearchaeota archaeon]
MKEGSHNQKKRYFLLIILTIIFTTFVTTVYAQQPAQCCYSENIGCVENINDLDSFNKCLTAEGSKNESVACNTLSQCDIGCCCDGTSNAWSNNISCPSNFILDPDVNSLPNYCESVCAALDTSNVQIIGNVTYNDGSPALAIISFQNETPYSTGKNANSDKEGYYSILIEKGFRYNVQATVTDRLECESEIATILVNNNHELDIELSCSKEIYCIPEWEEGPWSKALELCGTREVWQENCPPGSKLDRNYPPPHATAACVGEGGTCNHNGKLETGEECDKNMLDPFNGKTCQTQGPYTAGNLTCTNQCQITTEDCVLCPTEVSECSQKTGYCAFCDICKTEQVCTNDCESTTTLTFEAALERNPDTKVNLEWSIDNQQNCELDYYELTRCEILSSGKCSPFGKPLIYTFNKVETYYQEQLRVLDKKYQYNLTAYFNGFTKSVVKNVSAPDKECEGKPEGEFCNPQLDGTTLISYCDANGIYNETTPDPDEKSCDQNQDCVGPESGNAYCIQTDVCDSCNGPFGLFGYMQDDLRLAPEFNYITPEGRSLSACDVDLLKNVCYLDRYSKTNSAIGMQKACSDIRTCYDWKTEDSCLAADLCAIDSATNCEWKRISEELGIGICMPTNTEEKDCTKCDENSPIGACTEEICNYYGENKGDCYYNKIPGKTNIDKSTCINKENVGCETYDTKTECIGNPETEFKANITYDSETGKINYGNNEIIQNSNSSYPHTTKCYWIEQERRCVKDANMARNSSSSNTPQDCSNSDIKCLLDFENPITNMTIQAGQEYSRNEISNLNVIVTDNTYMFEDLKTYVNLVQNNSKEYQRNQFVELKDLKNILRNKSKIPSNTSYLLYYYSQDESNNLEKIRNVEFKLIPGLDDEGEINIDLYKKSKYVLGSKQILTNLTIKITNAKEIECSVKLTNTNPITGQTTSYAGDDTLRGTTLEYEYQRLEDGTYQAKIHCEDNHKQTYDETKPIIIDADTTIKNPTPRGKTFIPGSINISIETPENATCAFREINQIKTIKVKDEDITQKFDDPKVKIVPEGTELQICEDEDSILKFCQEKNYQKGNTIYYIGSPKPMKGAIWYINGYGGGDVWMKSTTNCMAHDIECYNETEKISVGQSKKYSFDNTGQTTHKSTLQINTQKFVALQPECLFDNGTKFIGNPGDTIYFAVDEQPPIIKMKDADTNLIYNSSKPQKKINMQFNCIDQTEKLKNGNTYYDFGCEKITYCSYYTGESGCSDKRNILNEQNSWIKQFNSSDMIKGKKLYLNLSAIDKGGNERIYDDILINVRNFTFTEPNVTICAPDQGISC